MKLLLSLLILHVANAQEESLTRYLRAQSQVAVDPRTIELKDDSDQNVLDRRSFVRYESSQWERIWLDNIAHWSEDETICDELHTPPQMKYMHDFLTLMCSATYEAPYDNWCIIDDEHRPLWYNKADRTTYDLSWVSPVPDETLLMTAPQPVLPGPEHEHIMSKMVFRDEETGEEYSEYVEPLVSHLRFPLSKCADFKPSGDDRFHWHSILFKGYILPPPPGLKVRNKYYFDAGASSWDHGSGGSSLKFFHDMWLRSGHVFDEIFVYDDRTKPEDFYKTVPNHIKDHVHFEQCPVASSPASERAGKEPFLPNVVKRVATQADYVVLTLDIDRAKQEHGIIDFLLDDPNNFIDEVAWEHHITGNYLMKEWGLKKSDNRFTLRESYELFLKMRQKGIRSHSWI